MITQPGFSSVEIANDVGNPIPVGSSPFVGSGQFSFGATATATSGSPGSFTVTVASVTGLCVGQTVTGTGIAASATIISINSVSLGLFLSVPNVGSVSGTLSFVMAAGAVVASGTLGIHKTMGISFVLGASTAFNIQVSNDGVIFTSITSTQISSATGVQTTAPFQTGLYRTNLSGFAFWRLVQSTAITAGTCTFSYGLTSDATDTAQPVIFASASSALGYGNSTYYANVSAAAGAAVTTTAIKASAANLGNIIISNTHSTAAFVKLFDSASALTSTAAAPPIFGTSAKIVIGVGVGQHLSIPIPIGLKFNSGVQAWIGANNSQTDGTSISASNVVTATFIYV